MKCKYEYCHNEAQGSGAYCSNSCRAQHSRRNKSSATLESSATSEAQHSSATWPDGSTEQGLMSHETLVDINRACGDYLDDPILTQSMLDSLPVGVSRPTSQPDAGTAELTANQLHSKVDNTSGHNGSTAPSMPR